MVQTVLQLPQQLASEFDALWELQTLQGRVAAEIRTQLDEQSLTIATLNDQLTRLAEQTADEGAGSFVGKDVTQLGAGPAALVNYAQSHEGFAAKAGLWINHPVWIEHRPGGAVVGAVNERIVETPYVLAALASLPPGSRILDFGASESTLALSLASLGHHVVALDLRSYPFPHPRIEIVAEPAETWSGPSRPFDAIVSLSALEHAGLGHYGQDSQDRDLDRLLLERFRGWLRPEGTLLLTAPFGPSHVDGFERTYDDEHLAALLSGWRILHRAYAFTSDLRHWDTTETQPPTETWAADKGRAVFLVRATPDA
jgi:hypothetical protein